MQHTSSCVGCRQSSAPAESLSVRRHLDSAFEERRKGTDSREYVLDLVRSALSQLESGSARLSETIQKCVRIARFRDDHINLWWLHLELINITSKEDVIAIQKQVSPKIPQDQFELLRWRFGYAWSKEREALAFTEEMKPDEENNILAVGVGEIEVEVEKYSRLADQSPPPAGLHPLDLYFIDQEKSQLRTLALAMESSRRVVLDRIKVRVHSFLSETEVELVRGQLHSDLFDRNMQYVDLKLSQIAPESHEQIRVAFQRLSEGNTEARSQALLSCRRVLKSLADILYPPRADEVVGANGKPRVLTEDKYITRLWQFVYENVGKTASREVLLSSVQDLGNRIDHLYDLASKGVHSEVSEFEVNQCVTQIYLLIGDLLRIHERASAIGLEMQGIEAPSAASQETCC